MEKNESNLENTSTEVTKNSKVKTGVKNANPPRFTKEQLVQSKKYSNNRDLLYALLEDDRSYSYQEADNIIQEFNQKGCV